MADQEVKDKGLHQKCYHEKQSEEDRKLNNKYQGSFLRWFSQFYTGHSIVWKQRKKGRDQVHNASSSGTE